MKRTRRFGIILIGLFLAVGVVALVLPTPRYVVRGWWNGENFYHGRPSSYWALVVEDKRSPVEQVVKKFHGAEGEPQLGGNPK